MIFHWKLQYTKISDPFLLLVEVLEQGTDTEHFPDFGLTVFKKSRYSCAIRAGSIGQKGKGGHAHNDQLSFCIAIDGIMLCTDPGTYLYTPLWQERNRFRSTAMHNTLAVESMEQNNWVSGPGDVLFWMLGDTSHAKTLEYSANHYSGEHYGLAFPTEEHCISRNLRLKPTIYVHCKNLNRYTSI
jgi:hypothetical protein